MADAARFTQVAVEYAERDTAGVPKVYQGPLTVVISPETETRAFQFVLEVLNNLDRAVEITDTLRLSGLLQTEITTETDWLAKQLSKKIYLVQLTLRYVSNGAIATEVIYLSNHPYNTRPTENPPNKEFIAVLEDQDVPTFTLQMSDVFFGLATPAFGALKINNADRQFDQKLPPNRQWEGGEFLIRLTGDRSELDLSDAITVMRGVMGKPKYDDNAITVELFSRQRELETAQLLNDTFDGPPDNLGTATKVLYPELYGFGSNIAPILKDEANLIYVVARAITAVDNVFDSGVRLDPSQYVVDLNNGTIQLLVNPAGQITCQARGRAINGLFSGKRGDFIYDMVTRRGNVDPLDFDVASLVTFNLYAGGESQFYVTSQMSVLDAVQALLRPVIGSLVFDRAGTAALHVFSMATVTDPVVLRINADQIIPSGATSDEQATQVAVSVDASDLLYYKVTLLYSQNLTVQTEDAIGASGAVDPSTADGRARRAWLKEEWRTSITEQTGATTGKNLYPTAQELGPLESYFCNKSDADQAGFNWLSLFGESRRKVTIQGKMLPLRTTLFSVINLSYRWFNNQPMRAISYQEDYGNNEIQVEVLV